MAKSMSRIGQNSVPESGAEVTFIFPSQCQHYYVDGSSVVVLNNGTRVARDETGREVGRSVPRHGDQKLMNGIASSVSQVILRESK